MKIPRLPFTVAWLLSGLAAGLALRLAAAEPAETPAEVKRLREALEEQTRRVDRLYRALGPHLADLEARAEEFEQQQKEDTALGLEILRDAKDPTLGSVGCANPASPEFAAITTEGIVRLFGPDGRPRKGLEPGDLHVTAIAYSPDGRHLLAGTAEGALISWALAPEKLSTIATNVGTQIARVAWLSGSDRVVWAAQVDYYDRNGTRTNQNRPGGAVLERVGGRKLWDFQSAVRGDFQGIGADGGGSTLLVLELPGKARGAFVLDGETGRTLQTLYDPEHPSGPLSVAGFPDGRMVAVGYAPNGVILWDRATGKPKRLQGHGNWVVALEFSRDGRQLISGSGDSTARIWDVSTGRETGRIRFPGPSTYVEGVGLTPDGGTAFALARGHLIVARVRSPGP
jgi:WD40 repeat protein